MEVIGRESPSNRIRNWRKFRGIKQDALAKKVGCSRSVLSSWENGKSFPLTPQLARLIKELNCTVAHLYPDLFPESSPDVEDEEN